MMACRARGGEGGERKEVLVVWNIPAAVIDYVYASNLAELLFLFLGFHLNQPQRCRDHCKSLKVSQSRFIISSHNQPPIKSGKHKG